MSRPRRREPRRGHFFVAGRNRLEAARQLKWDAIGCIELPDLGDVEDAETIGQLAEIAENLHRREIDTIERGELIAAWSRIRGEREGKVGQVGPLKKPGAGRGSTGGIRQAARDLGMARKTVGRSLKVAALSPEAKAAARSAGLANNQTALLKAAKHSEPAKQVAALQSHVKTRPPAPKPDPLAEFKAAWTPPVIREPSARRSLLGG